MMVEDTMEVAVATAAAAAVEVVVETLEGEIGATLPSPSLLPRPHRPPLHQLPSRQP